MGLKDDLLKWLKMFVIWSIILLLVGFGFEYIVFGSNPFDPSHRFSYTIVVSGVSTSAVFVYAILLGVAFSAAQLILKPTPLRVPSPPPFSERMPRQRAEPAHKAAKRPAKSKKKKMR